MLYGRKEAGARAFIILNRLNTENFICDTLGISNPHLAEELLVFQFKGVALL